MGINVKGLDGM